MKKIFTFLTALLMTVAVFAADRRPSVTLQGAKNYEVVIDGRVISQKQFGIYGINANNGTIEINGLRMGRHTVTVYEIPRRFFASRNKRVMSSTVFMLQGKDIAIKIDGMGQVRIKETRNGRFDNRDWDDRNDRNDRNNGYDKGYGQSQDAGWEDQNDHRPGQQPQDPRGSQGRDPRNGQGGRF